MTRRLWLLFQLGPQVLLPVLSLYGGTLCLDTQKRLQLYFVNIYSCEWCMCLLTRNVKIKKKDTLDPPLYIVKTSKNVWKRVTRYWNSILQLHFNQLGEARNGSLREKSFKIIETLYLNNFSLAWAYYIFSTKKLDVCSLTLYYKMW